MNKRGFDCALSRATSRAVFSPIFYFSISFFPPLFLLHITQASCAFFFFFYLVPHQVSNHLPFAYISLTSLSSTPLHHEIQLRFIPPKLIFILLDSLACPKISITIYLSICLTHAARLHENIHRICESLENKSGGDDLFLSRNRLHLSCSSRFVLINYINTMSSINFFRLRKILGDQDQ